jgi:hypothetical protein
MAEMGPLRLNEALEAVIRPLRPTWPCRPG